MIKFASLLFIYLFAQFSFSQERVRFNSITKADGLSNNTVFSIEQDEDGFMWFGTRNGLNRYDGYQIEKLYSNGLFQKLSSDDIRSLYYDAEEKCMWVGTINGLNRIAYNESMVSTYLTQQEVSLGKIERTNSRRLLFASSKGLYEVKAEDGKYELELKSNLPVETFLEDSRKHLWLATNEGLKVSTSGKKIEFSNMLQSFPELMELSEEYIMVIFEDTKGRLWFGTDTNGVFCWNIQKRELEHLTHSPADSRSLSSDRVRTIVELHSGEIYIGTSIGLNIYQERTNDFAKIVNDVAYPDGLNNNSIRSMHVDKKGGVWVGTFYRGVNYTDETFDRFNISYPNPSMLTDDRNIIGAIAADEESVWIGTEGKGVAKYNPHLLEFNFIELSKNIESPNIKVIYPEDEHIWIGTFQDGLIQYDQISNKVIKHYFTGNNSLPNNNVYDLLKNDSSLMLATYGGGLVFLDTKSGKSSSYTHDPNDPESIVSDEVRDIYPDHDGDIWLGTTNGLSLLTNPNNGSTSFTNKLKGSYIYSITSTMPGEIWIGTFYDGLYKYIKSTDSLIHFNESNGLPGNTVYSILPENGDLWLSTNNGIVKFLTDTNEVVKYGENVGLKGLDYSPNSAHVVNEKLFLFGSNTGLVYFTPQDIQTDVYVPRVLLTGLEILGSNDTLRHFNPSTLLDENTLHLKYDNSNIRISFASLDYTNPENNKYAFRMKGIDPDWIYITGNPEAIYTLQKEGKYTFEFKGSNSDGVWNPSIESFDIIIAPPWFRSWWIYIIYALLTAGVLYMLYRLLKLRNSYQIEHISKVEQERSLALKTRFFTNITHELRTPLTLMLGPLKDIIGKDDLSGSTKTKLEGVHRNVSRLSNLVNQLLDFRKLETDHMKMRVAEGDLIDLVKEVYFSFKEETTKRNIDFIFESEDGFIKCWYDADKLEKVFFNLLSNALKFTPDYGLIKIMVEQDKKAVRIKVQDNGRGIDEAIKEQIFERFYERNSMNYTHYGVGIGLALSKQLVELHSGSISAENNATNGSTFTVEIPQGKSHFREEDIVAQEKIKSTNEAIIEPGIVNEISIEEQENSLELKILIIEDDLEIQDYIKSLFIDSYQVFLANNGEKGFEIASSKLPDIIISDVMMPIMDGITLCRKIKTTIETSHIPIILLTARASTPYKIGGLETGADDYITKPFNSEELILKTKNILNARTAYLEKLSRTHDFDPKKIAITSTDEKFLTRLMELTEEHIENSTLSVEQLAHELLVSRALLFTKIKSLTGKTPKGFIKNIRLKRAAQLLKDTDLNISQVAYKSGFKDYRYFTKVFKAHYECSPKEYAEKVESEEAESPDPMA